MTKWKIVRLTDVDGKLNFSWEKYDNDKGAKWNLEDIERTAESMEIGEEKIIEI